VALSVAVEIMIIQGELLREGIAKEDWMFLFPMWSHGGGHSLRKMWNAGSVSQWS
jgi:hypothetical protein